MDTKIGKEVAMRRLVACLMVVLSAVSPVVSGCTQAPPTPTPTQPAAAPTKAAPPTAAPGAAPAAPTAAPTAAPAAKVTYPEKGKTITLIVPWPAGGSSDASARVLVSELEKELGVPVQVLNKAGAGSQVGVTEIAKSRPDGYTLGYVDMPTTVTIYLDAERQAAYGRKDLVPIALHALSPGTFAVEANSPYKTMKDIVDAAKAAPEKVKVGDPGILTLGHLTTLMVQKEANVKFANVHFEGGAPGMTALLGGHIDAISLIAADTAPRAKEGKARVLGVADTQESRFLPGVKTMADQGYKVFTQTRTGMVAPGGTPKEIVDVLAAAMKKICGSDAHITKMTDMLREVRYMDPQQYDAYWTELERQLPPLIEMAKKQ